MSNEYAPGQEAELWHVQLPNGQVHCVTLDQLDDAFQRGLVDANIQVCEVGSQEWSRLGDLAGIEDEPQPPAWSPAPASMAPRAPNSMAPRAPNSMAPVAMSVRDLDLSPPEFRSKKRGVVVVLGMSMALAAIAFAGMRSGFLDKEFSTAAAAQPIAAPAPVATTVATAAQPTPTPTPAAALPKAPSTDPLKPKTLSEEVKRALLESDDQRTVKRKARKARASKPKSKYKSAATFRSGGSAHDPLNSKL